MNEPHDNDDFDKEISNLYRDASQEQPPTHLDNAILATAKREVSAKPRPLTPFSRHWMLPASLAAVIVLSISVVTLVQKQPELTITSEADSIAMLAPQTEKPTARSVAPQEKQDTNKKETLAEDKTLYEEKIAASTPQMEQIVKSKPKAASDAEPQQRLNKSIESPKVMVLADESIDESKPVAKSLPQREEKMPTQITSEVEESEFTAAESSVEHAPSSTITTGVADTADATSKSRPFPLSLPSKAETAIDSSQMQQPPISERQALSALSASSAKQPTLCKSLPELQCLQANHCVVELDKNKSHYFCREALNHCEHGFTQLNPNQQSCEDKSNCRFIPGSCYCPPGGKCECSGGAPPMCVKK